MKTILGYLRSYAGTLNRTSFLGVSVLMAVLICFNYTIGIERTIMAQPALIRLGGFTCLYLFVFGGAWLLQSLFSPTLRTVPRAWYLLLFAACAIFAIKVSMDDITRWLTAGLADPWHRYGYYVLNWPLKCGVVLLLIFLVWRLGKFEGPVAGLQLRGFDVRPYWWLLLMMVPLIAFAGTQADFQVTYPKMQRIYFIDDHTAVSWPWKLLYELSYGVDFLTIETFFRGFLILAFARYAGAAAILPMAAFYCCIHFGKPLFECITSYFGGLILGAVVLNTRSIWGGLIVHLGIAWLMELAAVAM